MTDQDTIPADKVRGVINEIDGCLDGTFLNDQARRALEAAKVSIENILPAPPQPTRGLLGRWAKHPDYGDVMCVWDKPKDGWINIYKRANNGVTGAEWYQIRFSDLTFPHQATKPADVPEGEAWLVRHVQGMEFNAIKTDKGFHSVSDPDFDWMVCNGEGYGDAVHTNSVTLIAPLVPERPVSDLQAKSTEQALDRVKAKYDELESKYREAVEKIAELKQAIAHIALRYGRGDEQPSTPRTVTTEHDYATLPVRSVVAELRGETWEKTGVGLWSAPTQRREVTNADLAGTTRTVLRYGWGDEHPAWRIEHDHTNLRVGEYIIDTDGDTGTVTRIDGHGFRDTNGKAYGYPGSAPFIAFLNRDAATPETIEEARKARDKETGE